MRRCLGHVVVMSGVAGWVKQHLLVREVLLLLRVGVVGLHVVAARGAAAERARLSPVAVLGEEQERAELRRRLPHESGVVDVERHVGLVAGVEEDRPAGLPEGVVHKVALQERRVALEVEVVELCSGMERDRLSSRLG